MKPTEKDLSTYSKCLNITILPKIVKWVIYSYTINISNLNVYLIWHEKTVSFENQASSFKAYSQIGLERLSSNKSLRMNLPSMISVLKNWI
jgi:hypothetical protein